MVMATEKDLAAGISAKVSVLAWRSSRLRRVVASTLAGETLALTQGVAELEWVQALFRDIVFNDVVAPNWDLRVQRYAVVLPRDSELAGNQDAVAVVDAKSVFDSLMKQTAGSKQDRRTSVDLSLLRQSFGVSGTVIRWIPHPRMPVDIMTKSDVAKGNAAMTSLLKSGRWRLLDEHDEVEERKAGKAKPGRSKSASLKELAKDDEQVERPETADTLSQHKVPGAVRPISCRKHN